ncbi:MAG TPA: type II toxin-antitoxin system prevent-host-death family antitoxin [Flavobacteriales bacterium]|nr:type II toxin-antitoxin system prevent-host-death family antitoxin [Flavobacteriales bacterium]HNU55817.1 type II toxin-antitoxin system prevent-host-death family antitoxin [Flavobacteriales bacterium]
MALTAITSTSLREKLKTYLDRVSNSLETLIVSRGSNERDAVVIMSIETYNALTETNYLLSSEANRDRLQESIAELNAGKVVAKRMEDLEAAPRKPKP